MNPCPNWLWRYHNDHFPKLTEKARVSHPLLAVEAPEGVRIFFFSPAALARPYHHHFSRLHTITARRHCLAFFFLFARGSPRLMRLHGDKLFSLAAAAAAGSDSGERARSRKWKNDFLISFFENEIAKWEYVVYGSRCIKARKWHIKTYYELLLHVNPSNFI